MSNQVETSPNKLLELKSGEFQESFLITQGNTLLPASFLPFKGQVLGVMIESYNSYCDYEYLENYWSPELAKESSKLCDCESNGDPQRVNNTEKEYSVGLFQINLLAHKQYTEKWLKIPENNVKAAIEIYKENGWYPWLNCARIMKVLK